MEVEEEVRTHTHTHTQRQEKEWLLKATLELRTRAPFRLWMPAPTFTSQSPEAFLPMPTFSDTRKRLCLVEAPKPELTTVPACLSCQVLQGEAEAQSVLANLFKDSQLVGVCRT